MNEIKTSCASTDQQWNTWESIDWNKCETSVKKLQARIVKAQKEGRYGKVKALQWTLTHSFYAKSLAIKRVTSNKGKRTSGVDGLLWETPIKRFSAISELKRRGYKTQPMRRVHIKKSNGKLRPLGIPTMKDRAMQALYLMALEPIAETTADCHSYGFRKERCTTDAAVQCYIVLASSKCPEWVLEGDIKGCFDHISHEWLLNNIPMDKVVLRKWLKAGFVFNKELFPTNEGTPQGGIISPTLANMTLDGLQTLLAEKYKRKNINGKTYYPKVNLVRYADDFIITGRNKEMLENEVLPLVREFLSERGLTLSEEKTKITHIDEGFDFLGYNFRKYSGKFLTKPSKTGLKKFMDKLRGIIDSNKSSKQESIIRLLNPIIVGWSNYYKHSSASEIFRKADYLIFKKLWQWSLRRHPKKSKYWIANRYFRKFQNRNWCFTAELDKNSVNDKIRLKKLYDTKITNFVKIRSEANPFDPEWEEYFDSRNTYKMLQSLNGKKTLLSVWNRQKRKCPLCDNPIDKEHAWSMVELTIDGKAKKFLVHNSCRRRNDQGKEDNEPAPIS